MTKNNQNFDREPPITDQPTGEYPVLIANQALEQRSAEQDGPLESHKAAYWLSHLESEVSRLHAKWEGIDAEFKAREARIAGLQNDVEAREDDVSRLTAALQRETSALQAADERLASKDREVTALIEDRQKRDDRIAALATELADAEVAHKGTLERIEQLEAETARLHDTVHQEQTATAAVRAHNEELLTDQGRLRIAIQDLEIYINGRHDRWSELNLQLGDYKSGLLRLEETLKQRDAALARHQDENGRLAARVLDFERQSIELGSQRKERENAYEELQSKLAAHHEETERLKAGYAERVSETEKAIEKAVNAESRIESLELVTQQRDQSIEALTAEIERGATALDLLIVAKKEFATRVEELEKGLTESAQQIEAHHEDLRMSHHQLQLAQQQLAERTTQLASSQETLEQKSRHVERLAHDLSAMQKDTAGMRGEVQKLEARVAEVDRQRSEAAAEAEQLKLEVAARQHLVTSLEAELRAKQATEDVLERSLGRITNLGASLANLDQRMSRANQSPRADQSSPGVTDFAATLAADDPIAAVASEQLEALPMDLLLDELERDEVVDVGRQAGNEPVGKLIATIGGEERDYPIVSDVMTIGRGHASDIRIASHFVSRLHAKVRTDEGATIIEDAGSKNGVLVNSQRVRRRVLHNGDIVSIGGEFNLRFIAGMR